MTTITLSASGASPNPIQVDDEAKIQWVLDPSTTTGVVLTLPNCVSPAGGQVTEFPTAKYVIDVQTSQPKDFTYSWIWPAPPGDGTIQPEGTTGAQQGTIDVS